MGALRGYSAAMTPNRMRVIRETMYLPPRGLPRRIGRTEGNLRAMEAGQRPTPKTLVQWPSRLGAQ